MSNTGKRVLVDVVCPVRWSGESTVGDALQALQETALERLRVAQIPLNVPVDFELRISLPPESP